MKLYIEKVHEVESVSSISGVNALYVLKNEKGDILNYHLCSGDCYAKEDLLRGHSEWRNAEITFKRKI